MKELELKYGCNPNQKPAKIFMNDNKDLPVTVLSALASGHRAMNERLFSLP